MYIVSGTGRSGTSMWMGALAAAGVPLIGERFPLDWEQSLREHNPDGFYESSLRAGINFSTNPDPRTGQRLDPEQHKGHAVKVFSSGLLRTERRYIGRVVYTFRNWRAFVESAVRLIGSDVGDSVSQRVDAEMLAETWFRENVLVLFDASARGYDLLPVSYESALENPIEECQRVSEYLGIPLNPSTAVGRGSRRQTVTGSFPEYLVRKCDELHDVLMAGWPPHAHRMEQLAALLRA